MKITLRHNGINAPAAWKQHVEKQLNHLDSPISIAFAALVRERQRAARPAFSVKIRMEVPGPGIHTGDTRRKRQALLLLRGRALRSQAIGDTIQAALLKAAGYLAHRVKARQLKRAERVKNKLQLGGLTRRGSGTPTGQKGVG